MPFDQAGFVIEPKPSDRERQLAVLQSARDALHVHPNLWIKGSYSNDDGGHCAVGWLRHFSSRFRAKRIATAALVPVLPETYLVRIEVYPQTIGTAIQAYNDDPGTTHADIVSLFDQAITRLQRM